MTYFENFPLIQYKDSVSGTIDIVTDILKRAGIKKSLYDSVIRYYTEMIHTKDRPEVFASTLYDDPNKHWINMMINSVIDPYYDWVLSDENFDVMIKDKYPNKYAIVNVSGDYPIIGEKYSSSANIVVDYIPLPKIDDNGLYSQLIYSGDDQVVDINGNWLSISSSGLEVNAIHHLESVDSTYKVVTNLEYEILKNVSNESVNVIHEDFVDEIQSQLKGLFK